MTIEPNQIGVLTTLGKFERLLDPGCYTLNKLTQHVLCVSMLTKTTNVSDQKVLTFDNLTVCLKAICFWKVIDPYRYCFNIGDAPKALEDLIKLSLRTVVSAYSLQDLFVDRKLINQEVLALMETHVRNWGIQISVANIEDVQIPPDLQRVMCSVAEAKQQAVAKVLSAEGQQKAALIVKETAKTLDPITMQLIYFDLIREVSKEKSNKVFMPMRLCDIKDEFTGYTGM